MGSILSINSFRTRTSESSEISQSESCKRQRLLPYACEENSRLIPCLPDEISLQILARIPRICYLKMKLVSRAWRASLTNAELFSLRKELGTTEEWLYILTKVDNDKLLWYALDPMTRQWQKLPPIPRVAYEDEPRKLLSSPRTRIWNMVESSIRIADVIMRWLGKKNALDQMPLCGCAISAVDGCLYVLGGFSRAAAMRCVWRYDPVVNTWSESSPMLIGRAYCKTGILNNKLYVVGGVTRGRGGLTPLQSAEVFDPKTKEWSEIPSMPFTKAQVLPTAFLADLLKPMATGLTSYRGRLFVPQSLYCWPFFVDVGGEVYDPERNSWVEMPTGMGEGWPARQAGTKQSVTVDGELYALDPSSSLDSATLKVYDNQHDSWRIVARDVPISNLSDSESPYLLAGFLGKLHVITKDVNHNITILQINGQNHSASFSSNPSPSQDNSFHKHVDQLADSRTDLWKVIATGIMGPAELVSCQALDI